MQQELFSVSVVNFQAEYEAWNKTCSESKQFRTRYIRFAYLKFVKENPAEAAKMLAMYHQTCGKIGI